MPSICSLLCGRSYPSTDKWTPQTDSWESLVLSTRLTHSIATDSLNWSWRSSIYTCYYYIITVYNILCNYIIINNNYETRFLVTKTCINDCFDFVSAQYECGNSQVYESEVSFPRFLGKGRNFIEKIYVLIFCVCVLYFWYVILNALTPYLYMPHIYYHSP